MALWRVQLRQAINDGGARAKWSNVYFVETLSDQTAANEGLNIWYSQRNMHRERVFCYEIYATDMNPASEVYTLLPVPTAAQRGLVTGEDSLLPLFNVVRVDFPTTAGGRPSRKFYRLPVQENDQANGTLMPAVQTLVQTTCNAIAAMTVVRDESGSTLSGAVIRNITSRRLGRLAGLDVPAAPGV